MKQWQRAHRRVWFSSSSRSCQSCSSRPNCSWRWLDSSSASRRALSSDCSASPSSARHRRSCASASLYCRASLSSRSFSTLSSEHSSVSPRTCSSNSPRNRCTAEICQLCSSSCAAAAWKSHDLLSVGRQRHRSTESLLVVGSRVCYVIRDALHRRGVTVLQRRQLVLRRSNRKFR